MGMMEAIIQAQKLHRSAIEQTYDGSCSVTELKSIRLLLAPEISIKPGSRITVTQNGIKEDYQRSGLPAVYASHQEIELELFKEWA